MGRLVTDMIERERHGEGGGGGGGGETDRDRQIENDRTFCKQSMTSRNQAQFVFTPHGCQILRECVRSSLSHGFVVDTPPTVT